MLLSEIMFLTPQQLTLRMFNAHGLYLRTISTNIHITYIVHSLEVECSIKVKRKVEKVILL